jgi:hypothetical protein
MLRSRAIMSASLRFLLLSVAIAGSFVAGPACKRDGNDRDSSRADARKRGPRLPDPLPLPAEPEGVIYLANPAALLEEALAYTDRVPSREEISARVLYSDARPELGAALSGTLDFGRPWAMVHTADESVLALPILEDRVSAVAEALAPFATEGKFGAVMLPAPTTPAEGEPEGQPARPTLAWLDQDSRTLYVAESLPGLATGPLLE